MTDGDDLPPRPARRPVPMLVWIILAIAVIAAFIFLLGRPDPPVEVSQAPQVAVPTSPRVAALPDAKPE